MPPLLFKAKALLPVLRVQLGSGTTPYEIPVGATVKIVHTGINGTEYTGSAVCEIESHSTGIVSYDRGGPENAKAGDYHAEFQVWEGTTLLDVFPDGEYLQVTLLPSLPVE